MARQVRLPARLPLWSREEALACQAEDQGSSPGVVIPRKSSKNLQNLRKTVVAFWSCLQDVRLVYSLFCLVYRTPGLFTGRAVSGSVLFYLSSILNSYLDPSLCLIGPRWGLEPWSLRLLSLIHI